MAYYHQRAPWQKVAHTLFLVVTLLAIAHSQPTSWVLKFTEDFDHPLDFSRWSPHPPANLFTEGIQTFAPEAIEVAGGQAHITARRTKTGYTSGFLSTFGTFAQTYRRFEIRFRMPAGRGLEPIFQLLPIPRGEAPAIDVVDAIGSEPGKALFANRWNDGKYDRDYSGFAQVADLSSGFHTIAIEWDEEKIIWFVDGAERFQSWDGVPHQPAYLAISLSVSTAKAGEPNARTKFPATLDIDYIRVFGRPN